jgi:hypothetical protein
MTRCSWSIALIVTIVLLVPHVASAQEPETIDDLYELYDIDNLPADFVVVLDTSGSMAFEPDPPWVPNLEAVAALLESIPEGDHLSFLTFDSVVTIQSVGEVEPDTSSEVLDGLPDVPRGDATDIGAGIDATLRRLDRARPSPVQVVIFLTDGLHNPPPGSPFPGDTTSAPWEQLSTDAARLEASRDILAFGIGIEGGEAVDISPLQGIFRVTEIVNLPPEQLTPFFEEILERTRIARLRSEIERDLQRVTFVGDVQPDLEIEGRRAIATVDVVWDDAKLPTSVRIDEVLATGPAGERYRARLVEGLPSTLSPGETASVKVEVELPDEEREVTFGQQTDPVDLDIVLQMSAEVEPRQVLTAGLGVDPTLAPIVASASPQGERVTGIPWWVVGLLAGLLLLFTALFWWAYRRYLRLPRLSGALEFVDGTRIELRGSRMELPGDERDLSGTGTARLELFTRRGEPGQVYLRALAHPVFLDRHGVAEAVTEDARIRRHDRVRLDRALAEYVQ